MFRLRGLVFSLSILFIVSCEDDVDSVPKITQLSVVAKTFARFSDVTINMVVENWESVGRMVMFEVQVPNSGFITGFLMTTGNKTLRGIVQEKSVADHSFNQAVDAGSSAGKVSQTPSTPGRDMENFAVHLNVAANSTARFELRYQEVIKRRLGRFQQKFHVEPKQIVQDLSVVCTVEEPQIIRVFSYSLPNQTQALESSSSWVDLKATPKRRVVEFRPSAKQQRRYDPYFGIRGDFVVSYDVQHSNDGGIVLVQDDYFVHYFSPSGLEILPKNIIFVIDISGSMSGFKILKVREVMQVILPKLREHDYFNILLFDNKITLWQREPQTASASNIEIARRYADETLVARGSTNINSALLDAVDLLRNLQNREDGRGKVIVFLTDGHPTAGVTDPKQIRRNVRNQNEGLASIFALGFGSGVDMAFLEALASENGGFARKIYEESDASDQLKHFYEEISNPLLVDVQVNYSPSVVVIDDVTQRTFPQYFEGSELVVSGKLKENAPGDWQANVTAEGDTGSTSGRLMFTAKPETLLGVADVPEDFTERYWAFSRIRELLKMELVTEDPALKSLYHGLALNMSLAYQFVTSLTSMVVTESVHAGEEQPLSDMEANIARSRMPMLNMNVDLNRKHASGVSGLANGSEKFRGRFSPVTLYFAIFLITRRFSP